jgi:hypothetical protein
MIALTPKSRKAEMPDVKCEGSRQNSGKTKAPTMRLDGNVGSCEFQDTQSRLTGLTRPETPKSRDSPSFAAPNPSPFILAIGVFVKLRRLR